MTRRSGGNPNPRVANGVFWVLSEGAATSALLLARGLKLLAHHLCLLDKKHFTDFQVWRVRKGSSPRTSEALEDQGHTMLDNLSMRVQTQSILFFNHLLLLLPLHV